MVFVHPFHAHERGDPACQRVREPLSDHLTRGFWPLDPDLLLLRGGSNAKYGKQTARYVEPVCRGSRN